MNLRPGAYGLSFHSVLILEADDRNPLRGVEWVHCMLLFPLVFRENVVVTCIIGSFLCSLDTLLQQNVIVFFFGNQISKWLSFEKKGYFWSTFHIF